METHPPTKRPAFDMRRSCPDGRSWAAKAVDAAGGSLHAALTLRLLENRAEDIARVTARENEREMMIERGNRCFVDAA